VAALPRPVSRPRRKRADARGGLTPLGAHVALIRIETQSPLESSWRRDGFTAAPVARDAAEAIELADRVAPPEEEIVALDFESALRRLRSRGSPGFGRLETTIVDRRLAPMRRA